MTEWLLKTFVKGSDDLTDPKTRQACGTFTSILGIVANTVLCIAKMIAGLASGSLSIVADAVHNLADAASNVISLVGFKLAAKPADPSHPYGHGRFEYLSGLLVSALILLLGVELLKSSVDKIMNPEPVEFSWALIVVLAVAIVVILLVSRVDREVGTRIKSNALIAAGVDARNDVIATAAVLVAALISHFTGFELDAFMGAFVALVIIHSGIELIQETVHPLLGQAPEKELVDHIANKVLSYPGILGVHDLIVHDYGPGRQFATIHAEVAAEAPVLESHDVIDQIEADFRANDNMLVVIHMDPIVTSDPRVAELKSLVVGIVKGIDPVLTIHDFRMVPGQTHTNLIFDCVAPYGFRLSDDELRAEIGKQVAAVHPDHFCVIEVDKDFTDTIG